MLGLGNPEMDISNENSKLISSKITTLNFPYTVTRVKVKHFISNFENLS